jgi:single-stranded-DNA-specific exonuclease
VLAIGQRLGLADITARVLAGRGLGLGDVEGYLEPRLKDWLPDPSHLLDLDVAAERVARAVAGAERVGLIGDYDVDGATSTALVGRYLRSLGAEVHVEIPDRLTDGYGPNAEALGRLAAAGCRLVLTLDSGTTAFEALAAGRRLGLEVVVVDHHAAEAELPDALAVVNPNRQDQASPLKHWRRWAWPSSSWSRSAGPCAPQDSSPVDRSRRCSTGSTSWRSARSATWSRSRA